MAGGGAYNRSIYTLDLFPADSVLEFTADQAPLVWNVYNQPWICKWKVQDYIVFILLKICSWTLRQNTIIIQHGCDYCGAEQSDMHKKTTNWKS